MKSIILHLMEFLQTKKMNHFQIPKQTYIYINMKTIYIFRTTIQFIKTLSSISLILLF